MCPKEVCFRFGKLTLAVVCLLVAYPALCDSAAIDLVGRKGKVQVIERDGTVENVDPKDLQLNSVRDKSYVPRERKEPVSEKDADSAKEEGASDEAKDGGAASEKTTNQENAETKESAEDVSKEERKVTDTKKTKAGQDLKLVEKKKELTPEQAAARLKDVDAVKKMLDQGGAYFYKDDNSPLSYEEVKKMVESNDVEGIKALDLWQKPWTPTELPDKDASDTSAEKTPAKAASSYSTPPETP
ncbi:MAG: hypothetical protein WC655_13310 [Candidatus Hydrogenedentales bacterium]|jgi:hypothetical protein